MLIFGCFQSLALIQAFGPSCGLWPSANRRKTNIYAEVFDFRSGQEASAKIGLRLGGFEARNGQKRIRSIGTRPGNPDPKTRIKIGQKLEHRSRITRWINLTVRGRHVLCSGLVQPFGVSMQRPRRCPPGLSLRANPSGRARRLSTRYTD